MQIARIAETIHLSPRRWWLFGVAVAIAATISACNGGPAVLTQRVEAARLASSLHLEFTRATEAANRAVLSDMDDASARAADEATKAIALAGKYLQQLRPVVSSLGYADEIKTLDTFGQRFAEFQTLEEEILPLAVENTNLKAQRLSFGAGQDGADAFSKAVRAAIAHASRSQEAAAVGERSIAALLQVQVLQARHIAEPEEAAMSQMEAQMRDSESVARKGLARLRELKPSTTVGSGGAGPAEPLEEAAAALDRFMNLNREILELSRRNTNVRSLAMTLGRARVVSAACEDQLRMLE
ncbi:MAG: hypothetical protein ABMA15_29665, partial [Vicinamibacterales bacterium]